MPRAFLGMEPDAHLQLVELPHAGYHQPAAGPAHPLPPQPRHSGAPNWLMWQGKMCALNSALATALWGLTHTGKCKVMWAILASGHRVALSWWAKYDRLPTPP